MKPGTRVTRAKRSTIRKAIEYVPKIENSEHVEDVMFMLGLNDLRDGLTPEEVEEKTQDMLLLYQKHFPNARFHIVGVPPTDVVQHEEINEAFDKLAKFTGSQYVSTKVFLDEHTKSIRLKTMRDKVHYNDWGVRTICKEMKKSLFSPDNIGNTKLATLNRLRDQEPSKVTHPVEVEVVAATPAEITPPSAATPAEVTSSPETPQLFEEYATTENNQNMSESPKENYDPALLAQLC